MGETGRCPQCGGELSQAQSGLCPACLLRLGLSGSMAAEPTPLAEPPKPAPARRAKWTWIVAALALVALAAVWVLVVGNRQQPPPVVKLFVPAPEQTTLRALAVSPDGRVLAFTATDAEGRDQLWIRPLDSLTAWPLAGTTGAAFPFWSPDGRSLGFFAEGKLKTVAVSGGPAMALCDAPDGRGGAWGSQGTILFAPSGSGPLFRVPAAGGAAHPLTRLDPARTETSHRWPSFLPDGSHFLYTALTAQRENGGVYVGDLAARSRTRVLPDVSNAIYSARHLLFARAGTLMAQAFDPARLRLIGEPELAAEPLGANVKEAYAPFSASDSGVLAGVLAYDSWASAAEDRLTWFDREGKILGQVDDPALHTHPELSPDGKQVLFVREDEQTGASDLWRLDIGRGVTGRFTFDRSSHDGIWSPDGANIVFATTGTGGVGILDRRLSNGGGIQELLLQARSSVQPTDWSRDGRYLLYQSLNPQTGWDLWVLPLFDSPKKPAPFGQTAFSEKNGAFSPDGRWIAYDSNESGRVEVYVQAFSPNAPKSQGKWQVSIGGGSHPRWRRDGKELFYYAPNRTVMAAAVEETSAFRSANPRPLFTPRGADVQAGFAATGDGKRFMIPVGESEDARTAAAAVVLNWTAGLRR